MADDDLRTHVARGMKRLTDDVLMDRYGDPHVAFTVMLYPDAPPSVVALTPSGSGACDLKHLQFGKDADDSQPKGRFFTFEELQEAARGLRDAELGMLLARPTSVGTLGEQIMERVKEGWERHNTFTIDQTLKKAAVEQARPMVCPSCHQRYTKRGFPAHLRMSRWCGGRVTIDTDTGQGVMVGAD